MSKYEKRAKEILSKLTEFDSYDTSMFNTCLQAMCQLAEEVENNN